MFTAEDNVVTLHNIRFQLNESVTMTSPVTVTWPVLLGTSLLALFSSLPHLIEYRLVWADEAPLDHLLLAVRVGHGVADVEQLAVIGHVRVVSVHPALAIKTTGHHKMNSSDNHLTAEVIQDVPPDGVCVGDQAQAALLSKGEVKWKKDENISLSSHWCWQMKVMKIQGKITL